MWEDLRLSESSLEWVVEGLKEGSLVCVTDGSYFKKKAPNVCSAGWIIADRRTKRQIGGTLVEISPSADSYRGEMLGMLAIRLFLLAVEEFYSAVTTSNDICCDNKGALYTFERKSQRVPSGKVNTDIQRVLRTIKYRSKSKYMQHHVRSHQDRCKPWHKLTYEEQLNTWCDEMAKKAIESHLAWKLEATIEEIEWTEKYTEHLPLEKARVMVGGAKQTTDVSKGLKQVMGHQQARKFYATPNKKGKIIMETRVFDTVDWEAINLSLSDKPQMYKLWYGKQCSGWCRTGNNLKHWQKEEDKEVDTRCPNCFAITIMRQQSIS